MKNKYNIGDLVFDQNKFTKFKMLHLIIGINEDEHEDGSYYCLVFEFESNKTLTIKYSNIAYTILDKYMDNLKTQAYRVKK